MFVPFHIANKQQCIYNDIGYFVFKITCPFGQQFRGYIMGAMEHLTRREAMTLLDLIDAARCCSDIAGFEQLIRSLDRLLSFDKASCGIARLDGADSLDAQKLVNISYPKEWNAIYEERGFAAVDPVVRAHLTEQSSKIWSDTYNRLGRPQPFVSLAEDFGIRDGYSFGTLSPADTTVTIFALSVQKKPAARALTFLDMLAPHYHEAFRRATQRASLPVRTPLSRREKEVVRWLADGKNTWEISVILGISERTIKFHVGVILQKLNAVNRSHAVAIAISNGLIPLV
jgi:DNA-binding CsgD family transcriptional regulator